MADNGWWRYVQRIAAPREGKVTQKRIADLVGISEATVSRWVNGGSDPEPRHAVFISRHYGHSPVEGLISAGYLTPEEVDVPVTVASLGQVDILALVDELSTRVGRLKQAADAGDVGEDLLQRTGVAGGTTPLADQADGPPARLVRKRKATSET